MELLKEFNPRKVKIEVMRVTQVKFRLKLCESRPSVCERVRCIVVEDRVHESGFSVCNDFI